LLFRFPENDAAARGKWIDFVKQNKSEEDWEPRGKRPSICSQHFTSSDYMAPNSRNLKGGAIPSIFDKENLRKKQVIVVWL